MSTERGLSLFDNFHRDVDSMFRDFGRSIVPTYLETEDLPTTLSPFRGLRGAGSMRMDLVDRPNEYVVHMDVPGIPKDKIEINVENDVLTVSGEREKTFKDEGENYFRMERSYGKLSRSIRLPENADPERISAKCDGGELLISVPKSKSEQSATKKITIQ